MMHRCVGVGLALGIVHRLEKKMSEVQAFELFGRCTRLRKNKFELVSAIDHELCARFRADTNPINFLRRLNGSIRFHRDFKAAHVQGIDQSIVELQ